MRQLFNSSKAMVDVYRSKDWETYTFSAERTDGVNTDYLRCHFPSGLAPAEKIQVLSKALQDLVLSMRPNTAGGVA